MSIDIFGFRALWSPYFLAALILITLGYFLLLGKYKDRFKNASPLTGRQIAYFLSAMVLLYAVKGSPVDLLGHIMFSFHMTQMAVLYLVIPPLFILAVPDWLWRSVFSFSWMKPAASLVKKPLAALLIFNIIFSLYHVPLVFDFVKTSMWLHAGYTVLLFILALYMWFPLVNTMEEFQSLSGVKKVAYIFGSGILMTPACGLIIFSDHPLYETYSSSAAWAAAMELCVPAGTLASLNLSSPEMFNGLPLMEDQQLGGVIMKIIQELVLGVVLGYIFYAWYNKENGGPDQIDPIPAHLQPND